MLWEGRCSVQVIEYIVLAKNLSKVGTTFGHLVPLRFEVKHVIYIYINETLKKCKFEFSTQTLMPSSCKGVSLHFTLETLRKRKKVKNYARTKIPA